MLFLPEERSKTLLETLQKSLSHLTDIFRKAYRTRHIKNPVQINHHTAKCCSGCTLSYFDQDSLNHNATCGAILGNDDGNIYILSSCHGNRPQMCYFSEPVHDKRHPCEHIATGYEKDPLLDVALFEVSKRGDPLPYAIEPMLHMNKQNIALCGPYDGTIDDLLLPNTSENASKGKAPKVMKYGAQTKLTKGLLSFYKFNSPADSITDALVIAPQDGDAFSKEGDCGSVVFLEDETPDSKQGQVPGSSSYHEALAMICFGVEGIYPEVQCSLGFRLDAAFKFLELELKEKLYFAKPSNVSPHIHEN